MKKVIISVLFIAMSVIFLNYSFARGVFEQDELHEKNMEVFFDGFKRVTNDVSPPYPDSVVFDVVALEQNEVYFYVVYEISYKSDDGRCVYLKYEKVKKGPDAHMPTGEGVLAALDQNLFVDEYKEKKVEWVKKAARKAKEDAEKWRDVKKMEKLLN